MVQTKPITSIAELKPNNLSTATSVNFEEDAGVGFEGTTSESFAIPFLTVLQKGSPACDEALGTAIEGARAGMFYENVTNRLFDGKKGVLLVPCACKRVFIRWGAKDIGGGFKGEVLPEVVAKEREIGKIVEMDNRLYYPLEDGSINPKRCDMVSDTRNHFVLLVDEETGAWTQMLMSLSSTQIKKSKQLLTALDGVRIKGPNGLYRPAPFSNYVRATTIGESNDQGAWFGVRFELSGKVERQDLYDAGRAFFTTINNGGAGVKYEESNDAPVKRNGF